MGNAGTARHRLSLPVLVATLAAVGIVRGLVLAVREMWQQQYLDHGFWRTCLWIARDCSVRGATLGLEAGLLAAVLLFAWPWGLAVLQRRTGISPAALRLAIFTALCTAAVALFVPPVGPVRLHLPYPFVLVTSFAALWLLLLLLASRDVQLQGRESSDWFKRAWLAIVGFTYLVFFLRSWGGGALKREVALVTVGGLIASILAYRLLWAPVRSALHMLQRALYAKGLGRLLALDLLVLAAAIALWMVAGIIGVQTRAQAGHRGRSVILIGVDALRADRVSLLSKPADDRDLTPNLRKLLAARGTIFTDAISQAPWTLPAFASILTGLYPEQHGAEHLTGTPLPATKVTLAEILREAGYQTLGVVSHHYVGAAAGLDRGFSAFDESQNLGLKAITSRQVTDLALQFLREHRRKPFFLFAHYLDPHYNYMHHPEFHFSDHYTGWLRDELGVEDHLQLLRIKQHLFAPAERAYLRDLYDEEVAYTDTQIGRLLAFLDETGLRDSTLVILVSDHGEEFDEHGSFGHVGTLYQELIHVPLVIAAPSQAAPRVIPHPVETRWLFGTVLDFHGVAPPKGTSSTPSLLASPANERTLVRSSTRPVRRPGGYGAEKGYHVWLSCLAGERWKVIKNHLTGATMLFDLLNDPGETRDLGAQRPELRRQLERALRARDAEALRRAPSVLVPHPDEEEIRRLKSLGYL